MQSVWFGDPEFNVMVEFAFTVMDPFRDGLVQGPDVETVKLKVPDSVGVPLIVNTPALNEPVTPVGKAPEVIEAPVAPPPTSYVIIVIGMFMQTVWAFVPCAEEREMVEFGFTVMDPVRYGLLQGPVVVTV